MIWEESRLVMYILRMEFDNANFTDPRAETVMRADRDRQTGAYA